MLILEPFLKYFETLSKTQTSHMPIFWCPRIFKLWIFLFFCCFFPFLLVLKIKFPYFLLHSRLLICYVNVNEISIFHTRTEAFSSIFFLCVLLVVMPYPCIVSINPPHLSSSYSHHPLVLYSGTKRQRCCSTQTIVVELQLNEIVRWLALMMIEMFSISRILLSYVSTLSILPYEIQILIFFFLYKMYDTRVSVLEILLCCEHCALFGSSSITSITSIVDRW